MIKTGHLTPGECGAGVVVQAHDEVRREDGIQRARHVRDGGKGGIEHQRSGVWRSASQAATAPPRDSPKSTMLWRECGAFRSDGARRPWHPVGALFAGAAATFAVAAIIEDQHVESQLVEIPHNLHPVADVAGVAVK